MLHNILENKRGKRVWLDRYAADRSEKGMVAGVTESDVFICCVSEKYFSSWFCCLEMHTAIGLRRPIVVVFNISKVTIQTALQWVPAELKPLLKNNELLPIHEDIQLMEPCVDRVVASAATPFDGPLPPSIGGHRFDRPAASSLQLEAAVPIAAPEETTQSAQHQRLVASPPPEQPAPGTSLVSANPALHSRVRDLEVVTLCIEGDISKFDDARLLRLRKELAHLLADDMSADHIKIRPMATN
eukprot:1773145-Prymnesium_polylepis.1